MDELDVIRLKKMREIIEASRVFSFEVNDNNFKTKVIERSSKTPVVVDFWAEWCTPCRVLGPVLEKLAKEYKGKFILAKVNVDHNPILIEKYGIMSIPSVKMFRNGKVVDEFVGALPEPDVRRWLEKNLP